MAFGNYRNRRPGGRNRRYSHRPGGSSGSGVSGGIIGGANNSYSPYSPTGSPTGSRCSAPAVSRVNRTPGGRNRSAARRRGYAERRPGRRRHPTLAIVLIVIGVFGLIGAIGSFLQDRGSHTVQNTTTAQATTSPVKTTPMRTETVLTEPEPVPEEEQEPVTEVLEVQPAETVPPAVTAMPELNVYDTMYNALLDYQTVITLNGVEGDEVLEVYHQIFNEHPELFWLAGGSTWSSHTDESGTTVTIEVNVRGTMEGVEEKNETMWAMIDSIVSEANTRSSDYEKALFIHDYLVEETEYDIYSYNNREVMSKNYCASAYGCIVENLAVCAGYSAAYKLLLNQLGIECECVSGSSKRDDHQWNYICLDGEYYYVDVTWDDPTSEDGDEDVYDGFIAHEYFCITTEQLLADHIIGEDEDPPLCEGTYYNYYRYNGLYFDTYSFDEIQQFLEQHRDETTVEIAFSTADVQLQAWRELHEEKRIWDIPFIKERGGTVWFSNDPASRVLRISFTD